MTEEQKTNILNLIEALKTYPKVKEALRTADGFCCIGVLCELSGFISHPPDGRGQYDYVYEFGNDVDDDLIMPYDIFTNITGLSTDDMHLLMRLNDNCNTFYPVIEQLYYLLNKMEN